MFLIIGPLITCVNGLRGIFLSETVELVQQICLQGDLCTVHEMAQFDLDGAQAANVGDVNVEQTLERESLHSVQASLLEFLQHLGQGLSQLDELVQRDVDAEFAFEETKFVLSIELLATVIHGKVIHLLSFITDKGQDNGTGLLKAILILASIKLVHDLWLDFSVFCHLIDGTGCYRLATE